MNPKPGFINARIGVFFKHDLDRISERITIELETPFTYIEAKNKAADHLQIEVRDIDRITFN